VTPTLSVDAVHETEMLLLVVPVTVRFVGVDGAVVSDGGDVPPPALNVRSTLSRSGFELSELPSHVQANVIIPDSRDAAHCPSMWFSSSAVGQRHVESWNACATPQ